MTTTNPFPSRSTTATSEVRSSAVLPEHEDDPHTLHIFMLIKSTRRWLDQPTSQRMRFLRETVTPILAQRPEVRLRYFDAEAFNTRATDVILWETDDLSAYQWICDELRETAFWDDYFEIVEIVPSLEANYFHRGQAA
jgi:hypothetical protein